MITRKTDQHAIIFLLLGTAAILFAPIFVRLSEVGPSATAFYRIFFSILVLFLWMYRDKNTNIVYRQPSAFNDYFRLALAGLFFAGNISFWHWSIKLTSIANSTLLANFAPIFIILGGFCFFGERFSRTFLVGMFLAMLGALFLLGNSFVFKTDQYYWRCVWLSCGNFLCRIFDVS